MKAVYAEKASPSPPQEDEGLGFLVRMTHRAFMRALNAKLALHEVPSAQWSALRQLWKEDGCSQVELANRMRVEKASLTLVLDSMKDKGFITLERSAEDRRKSVVRLTAAGRALKAKLLPYATEVNAQATVGLSKVEVLNLKAQLQQVLRNLGD